MGVAATLKLTGPTNQAQTPALDAAGIHTLRGKTRRTQAEQRAAHVGYALAIGRPTDSRTVRAKASIQKGQNAMSEIENRPVILEMLDQVRWFSFGKGWESESRLTIWQAIAYIMGKSDSADQVLREYVDEIWATENEMFDELSETSEAVEMLAIAGDDECNPKIKRANRVKAAIELQEWLPVLEKNRLITMEHFDIPSVLYQVVQSEIQAGRKQTLRISRATRKRR